MKVVGEIGGLIFKKEFHPLLQALLPYFIKIMPQTKTTKKKKKKNLSMLLYLPPWFNI
jgi:hypothetical protein